MTLAQHGARPAGRAPASHKAPKLRRLGKAPKLRRPGTAVFGAWRVLGAALTTGKNLPVATHGFPFLNAQMVFLVTTASTLA